MGRSYSGRFCHFRRRKAAFRAHRGGLLGKRKRPHVVHV